MPVNADKPHLWKADVEKSVDFYNNWFMDFAPQAFRDTRVRSSKDVESALRITKNLRDISPSVLRANPAILPMLRMCTCPPIARDRLIGLSKVKPGVVISMETKKTIPSRMLSSDLTVELRTIGDTIEKMADVDIFTWLGSSTNPSQTDLTRAATIVADRLCGAVADPIIRNAQEQRQLNAIGTWLQARGYSPTTSGKGLKFDDMKPGTYSFRLNVPVKVGLKNVNIPVDTVVMPKSAQVGEFPLLIEAKSAGDFTNTNKRRKEEAIKIAQLRKSYGRGVRFILFLCGYFDSGYLGYEAAEEIDWVWEHRIDDFSSFGL